MVRLQGPKPATLSSMTKRERKKKYTRGWEHGMADGEERNGMRDSKSATSRIDVDKPHVPEPSVSLRIGLPGPPVDVRL